MKIAFYKGKAKLFNRLVSWWMMGPYSHCESVVGEIAEGSVCWSSSFRDGGIRCKVIQLDPNHWDIIEIDADPYEVEVWFKSKLGCKYDTLGLVGFIVRIVRASNTKYFCSEAIAASLKIEQAWRFDPNALYCMLTRNDKEIK